MIGHRPGAALLMATLSFSSALAFAETPMRSPEVAQFVRVEAPVVILQHVRVIDGTGKAAVDDRNVVIEGGKISRIEAGSKVPAAEGVTVLDLTGHTVIPGLVGMHNHLFYIGWPNYSPDRHPRVEAPLPILQMIFSAPRMYLAAGVTTMRTTGSMQPYADLNLRHQIEAGLLPGPHIEVTAPYLEGKPPSYITLHPLTGPQEATEFVDYWARVGVTSFKAYAQVTRGELKAAIEAAHRHGLKLTGHLCAVTYPEAAELGIDNLEHGFWWNSQLAAGKKPDECPEDGDEATILKMDPAGPEAENLIRLLVSRRVAVTSTLAVLEGFVAGRPPLQSRVLEAMSPQARQDYLLQRARRLEKPLPDAQVKWAHELAMERRFVEAGGLLLSGPDAVGFNGVVPGFGDQRGIELLVEAGFTPVEAIRIATLNGAVFLGKQDRIGSIEPGKNADLVVIRGNPAQRIDDIENTEIVFKDGVGYDSAKLLRSIAGRYGQY